MSQHRDFGLPGIELTPGDHICALYLGQRERDDIVVPYLWAGLRAGEKVICIIDSPPLDDLARVADGGGIDAFVATQQLELHQPEDAYLRVRPFSPEAMIGFWESAVAPAVTSGSYDFARAAGQMPLELQSLPRSEFFRYEAEVNRLTQRYPQAYLCLYDLQRFGGGFMVDLLRTHPRLLMGGLILENPHYRPPGDLVPPVG
jgi:hypothetical protein